MKILIEEEKGEFTIKWECHRCSQARGRCRSSVRHDRTIHTFDSQGNAIWVGNWVGDFFVHHL
jgi:hypothetical protein